MELKLYIKNQQLIIALQQYLSGATIEQQDTIKYIYDILKSYNLDDNCFVATALFLLKPKEEIDYEVITKQFGEDISQMLKNLNSVGIKHNLDNNAEFESVRNMLIVMSQDVRVLIILLACNVFKVEHLDLMSLDEQKLFMRSVKEIYAPLSARLSLNELKNKMEDAVFKFFEPVMYEQLSLDERLNK
ncbi:MAG: HD domain-containing protein, partial [Clostridia bacterium]